jgi:hypothetical protein
VLETGPVFYSSVKNNSLFVRPAEGVIQVAHPGLQTHLANGKVTHLHSEKLLWIDGRKNIAVIAALLLPIASAQDFSGRIALGFRLGLTQRQRQYILAPFDTSGRIGDETSMQPLTHHITFGRSGLIKKVLDSTQDSELQGHTPQHHESLKGIMEQVGHYTSDMHFEISLKSTILQLRDISLHGTWAVAP